MDKWENAQQHELQFWGDCANTLGEELKQLTYAKHMGLGYISDGNSPYNFYVGGKKIIDIGCGPVSLLLKVKDLKFGSVVLDPLLDQFPGWVLRRCLDSSLTWSNEPGESLLDGGVNKDKYFDEAWIYNVLSHTQDPEKVIKGAKRVAKRLRIFEWLEDRQNEAHIHSITKEQLDEWIGQGGGTAVLDGENECYGRAYFGVFNFDGN